MIRKTQCRVIDGSTCNACGLRTDPIGKQRKSMDSLEPIAGLSVLEFETSARIFTIRLCDACVEVLREVVK